MAPLKFTDKLLAATEATRSTTERRIGPLIRPPTVTACGRRVYRNLCVRLKFLLVKRMWLAVYECKRLRGKQEYSAFTELFSYGSGGLCTFLGSEHSAM
jgi:hypothetical protein